MVDRSDGSGDTTFTKVFVGGLAWETKRDAMRRYFEQFGEILEAVVISDKNTGRSKGYGFVTFRDPESARTACENPFPVIDGRRANCNLASIGARKNRPTATSVEGMERFRQKKPAVSSSSNVDGHPTYFHQTVAPGSFPYSYRYPVYSQDFFPMGYYGVYGGHQQQVPSYYPSSGSGGAGSHGFYLNYYPYYAHPGPSQYPKLVQYPVLPQQFRNTLGFSAVPNSPSPLPIMTAARPMAVTNMAAVGPGSEGNVSEQKSSS